MLDQYFRVRRFQLLAQNSTFLGHWIETEGIVPRTFQLSSNGTTVTFSSKRRYE